MTDPERLLAEAAELSFPRYPGTPGDARAIEWVAGKLAAAGLAVSREELSYDVRPAFRALRAVLLWAAAWVAAAGWWAHAVPVRAALALAATAVPAAVFLAWAPGLERVYRRPGPTRTANVVGRRPAAGPPRLTLVLLAHHDSKSQNLTLPWRMGLTLLAIAGFAGLAVAVAVALAGGGNPSIRWAHGCAGPAVLALVVLSTLSNGNRSPGGVDNAGSVAILLELARRLPAEVPADVELIFLSPGAEEDHMVGAMRWLDAHREELGGAGGGRPVYGLNFDGAGAPGRLVLLEWFGFGRAFAPTAAAAARRAAAALGEPVRRVLLPPAQGVDAIPFVHRGIECLTFSSGSLGPAVWNVHSAGDRPELLDPDVLARAVRLARATVQELMRP